MSSDVIYNSHCLDQEAWFIIRCIERLSLDNWYDYNNVVFIAYYFMLSDSGKSAIYQ